ncbi:hypothetical protein HK405_000952, partial [Cladochytrium tenue]
MANPGDPRGKSGWARHHPAIGSLLATTATAAIATDSSSRIAIEIGSQKILDQAQVHNGHTYNYNGHTYNFIEVVSN